MYLEIGSARFRIERQFLSGIAFFVAMINNVIIQPFIEKRAFQMKF